MRDGKGSLEVVVVPPDAGLVTRTPSNQTQRSGGRALSVASNVRAARGSLYSAPGYDPMVVDPAPASSVNLILQANLQQGPSKLVGDATDLYSVGPAFVPSVDAGPAATLVGPSYTLQGSARGYLGVTIGTEWTQLGGPGTLSFDNPLSPTAVATASAPGLYVLELTGSDGIVTVSAQTTVRFISPDAGGDQTAGIVSGVAKFFMGAQLVGATLPLVPSSDGCVVAWSQVSGPAALSFSSTSVLNPLIEATAAGAYVVRLTATLGTYAQHVDVTLNAVDSIITITDWTFTDEGFIAGGQAGALRTYTDPSTVAAPPWAYVGDDHLGLKMSFENDINCLNYNPNTQTGTATATIQSTVRLLVTVNWSGMGEQQAPNFELMSLYANGMLVGSAHAPGGGLGCAPMAPVVSDPAPPVQFIVEAGTPYDIYIYTTTADGLFTGPNAFYQFTLSYQVIS